MARGITLERTKTGKPEYYKIDYERYSQDKYLIQFFEANKIKEPKNTCIEQSEITGIPEGYMSGDEFERSLKLELKVWYKENGLL